MKAEEKEEKREEGGVLDDLVEHHQFADELEVHWKTLSIWDRKRIGPPRLKLPGGIFYRRKSINEWLEDLEARAASRRRRR